MTKMFQMILMLALTALCSQAFAEDGVTVNGFVDTQLEMNRGAVEIDNSGSEVAGSNNRFLVHQGAVYFGKKSDVGEFFLDIPFTQNAAAGTLTLASGLAQAYVVRRAAGYNFTIGQFDTIYKHEANDTVDLFYARHGAVFDIMPVTHTGLTVNKQFGDITGYLLVGNSDQAGVQADNEDMEMGLKVGYNTDMIRTSLAVLSTNRSGACNFDDCEGSMLIDFIIGKDFGPLSVDVAFDQITNPGGESKVSVTEDRDPITGILLDVKYAMNDESKFGLRYEQVTAKDWSTGTDPAVGGAQTNVNDTSFSKITLGYTHACDKMLTLKANVSSNTLKFSEAATAEDPTWVDGQIAAVFKF